jgi:hypothetical protein
MRLAEGAGASAFEILDLPQGRSFSDGCFMLNNYTIERLEGKGMASGRVF